MDKKATAFLIVSLIVLLISFTYSFINSTEIYSMNYPIVTLTIICFIFGALFFGFFSFIPHILIGLTYGSQKNATIFILLLPLIIATYAGTKFGSILLDDFNKKKYFLEEGKPIIYLMITAILFALLIEITLPIALQIQIIPTNFGELNFEEPPKITSIFEKLNSLK